MYQLFAIDQMFNPPLRTIYLPKSCKDVETTSADEPAKGR